MDRRSKRILLAFGVALLAIIIIEIVRPKPLDWRESFTAEDNIPFGSFIISEEMESLFNNSTTKIINQDPFEFLRDSIYVQNSLYFFVNSSLNFDKRAFEKLSNYVRSGNTVFLSSRNFGAVMQDSLDIDNYSYNYLLEEEIRPAFFSPSFQVDSLPSYKKGVYKSIFTAFDTINTTALGYYYNEGDDNSLEEINFIKVVHGKGAFYFHTLPEAFSNYYLMTGNQEYVASVLSYLNPKEIYWDNYLKSGRKVVSSPMRFVLSQESLKWAYYIISIGILFFVIFRVKRTQRISQVIEPLKNSSLEFTKTIGDLHFQHKDFGNIISKKITYFLEKVRSQYYLDTNTLDDTFCEKLAQKSANTFETTQNLINTIKTLKSKSIHTEKDLINFNKLLEEFTN